MKKTIGSLVLALGMGVLSGCGDNSEEKALHIIDPALFGTNKCWQSYRGYDYPSSIPVITTREEMDAYNSRVVVPIKEEEMLENARVAQENARLGLIYGAPVGEAVLFPGWNWFKYTGMPNKDTFTYRDVDGAIINLPIDTKNFEFQNRDYKVLEVNSEMLVIQELRRR